MDGSTFFVVVSPSSRGQKYKKMKKKTLIIILSVVCLALLTMVIFIGGYKTNFFNRQFVKLGWVKERTPTDCSLEGWYNCLKKLNIDVDVVFYGASHTTYSDFRNYFSNLSICNLGRPSDNLNQLTSRAYTIESVNPEKVFVQGTANGLKKTSTDDFKRQYEQMIIAIQKAVPEAKIYLQSILPVVPDPRRASNEKIRKCNQIIDTLAHKYNCTYVDIYHIYERGGRLNPEYVKEDSAHFYPEHYDKWAEIIRPYIYN